MLKTAPQVWSRTLSNDAMEPSDVKDAGTLTAMSKNDEDDETDGIRFVVLNYKDRDRGTIKRVVLRPTSSRIQGPQS